MMNSEVVDVLIELKDELEKQKEKVSEEAKELLQRRVDAIESSISLMNFVLHQHL